MNRQTKPEKRWTQAPVLSDADEFGRFLFESTRQYQESNEIIALSALFGTALFLDQILFGSDAENLLQPHSPEKQREIAKHFYEDWLRLIESRLQGDDKDE